MAKSFPKKAVFCLLSLFVITCPSILYSQTQDSNSKPGSWKFRDAFYLPHELRLKYPTYDCLDFVVTKQEEKEWNSLFSVITGFDDSILETRILKGIQTIEEAREYFEKYQRPVVYLGATIREVTLADQNANVYKLYWVGHRAFSTLKEAKEAVRLAKKEIEAENLSFEQSLIQAKDYAKSFEGVEHEVPEEPVSVAVKPHFEQEEDIFYGLYDGIQPRRFWGKYPDEDWYLYQSTFESTYRNTNFDSRSFNSTVGFWSHRVVIRGLKFLDSSIDPYIEGIVRGETNGVNFNTTLDWAFGVEYRPFRLNKTLAESPWTEWIRNFRINFHYKKREPLKEIIFNSRDHDYRFGVDFFKEWGIDMPKEGEKDSLLWGELFMDHRYERTDFTVSRNYNDFIFNTAGKVGFKWPRFSLPQNSINDELVLMPYLHFDEVNTTSHTSYFQNRFFLGVGVRVMPFRAYRFMNSQWAFRTKLFFEYAGLGAAQYNKAEPPSTVPDRDYRLGLNVSLNRF